MNIRPGDLLARMVSLLTLALCLPVTGEEKNGFDLRESLVPSREIHLGGPARDGIPAIDDPKFADTENSLAPAPDDRVLGLVLHGQARAYPIAILNWHEIVNDRVDAERIVVTYCPLCGTGVAFRSESAGRQLTFGVSGLLYNSDVLLYDRETDSLWSQLSRQAISGPLRGETLTMLPLVHTTWRVWKLEHPETRYLTTDTGFDRDYAQDPYAGYADRRGLYFPVNAESRRYHPKERVLGLEIAGRFKAYPFSELARARVDEISDHLAGEDIRIRFDPRSETARAFDESGNLLPGVTGFWFAWYAFHPDTEIYSSAP